MKTVWVFNGEGVRLPSGVFEDQVTAEYWIQKHKLSGLLSEYPLGIGTYDAYVENEWFLPKKEAHFEKEFIQKFSGGKNHFHYENGERG